MAEQKFRLPGSSYEELKKIIIAYSHVKGKASNDDISKRAALHPTVVVTEAFSLNAEYWNQARRRR